MTNNIDIDVSVARLFAEPAKIALKVGDPGNSARGSLNGVVHMGVTLVGVEVSYHL